MNRQPYLSDLSDEQWLLLEPMLPLPFLRGRKRAVDLREIVNATLYLLWTGCAWRYLPHEFPKLAATCLWLLQVVNRNDDVKGFVVLPKGWVVKRTFG